MEKTKDRVLTQKQYSFASNYIKNGFNAYKAAIEAGYSDAFARVSAPALVHHPVVKKRIDRAFQRSEQRIDVSFDWRLNKLKRLVDEVIPDDPNVPIRFREAKTAIAALAEINKMYGDYAPDKRLSVTVDATKEKLEEVRRLYKEY